MTLLLTQATRLMFASIPRHSQFRFSRGVTCVSRPSILSMDGDASDSDGGRANDGRAINYKGGPAGRERCSDRASRRLAQG